MGYKVDIAVGREELKTWTLLNDYLGQCVEIEVLEKLLSDEQKGRNRKRFVLRINSRLSKLRRASERAKLEKGFDK